MNSPLPNRRDDFLQCGLARGSGASRNETLVEIGYHLRVTSNLAITPIMQVVVDPVQNPDDSAFVIAGLRALYVF